MPKGEDTSERILDAAQAMAQKRGYNGVSYRDISQVVGVRTASIHYHFASKEILFTALAERYRTTIMERLEEVSGEAGDALARVKGFIEIFRGVLEVDDRMCLCGMLSAESNGVPDAVNVEVRAFFKVCEDWLTEVLATGREAREVRFTGAAGDRAKSFLAVLEGAMMVAHSFHDIGRFDTVASTVLNDITPK